MSRKTARLLGAVCLFLGAAALRDRIGFIAWVMFWLIVLFLAPLHYIVLAITGKPNEELKEMTLRAVHYLVELLVFVTGAGGEKPFPLGPFPKV